MLFEDQSISGIVFPPIQMTSFGWFFTKFSIALVKWAAYFVPLLVDLYMEATMAELTSSQVLSVGMTSQTRFLLIATNTPP